MWQNINETQLRTDKLLEARVTNAKAYWKLLNETSGVNNSDCNISTDSFLRYFRAINDPESVFFQADDDIIQFNEIYLRTEIHIMFDELNVELSHDEIYKGISQLQNSKSGGLTIY